MDGATELSGSGSIACLPRKSASFQLPLPGAAAHSCILPATMIVLAVGTGTSAAADIANGKAAFGRQCAICHTIDKGGPNGFGPNLFGIVGRRAGTSPDFKYSNAFKTTATFEWSEGLLGHWISLPAVMVPGTTMGIFPGVAERDRDDIVAYVASQR